MQNAEQSAPPSHYEQVVGVHRQDVGQIKQNAYAMMNELIGWCSHEKAAVLIDLILNYRPRKIVEIGVWGGKSLVPMAYALKVNGVGKICGIDPWDTGASLEGMQNVDNQAYWSTTDHNAILQMLLTKIDEFDLTEQIDLIRMKSEEVSPIKNIDLLHIDGNHGDKTSYLDVTKWVPFVRSGGWIVFDDMTWYENGVYTTARAVEWLNEHCIKLMEFNDNCVWGIWIKP